MCIPKIALPRVDLSGRRPDPIVRQAFQPILEAPVMIQDADRPIGTHVFTGMERSDDARDMRWTVVSMPSGHPDGGGEPSSRARGYRDRDAGPTQRGQSDPRPEGSKRGHRGGRKGSGLALVVHLPGMMAGGAADPGGVRDCGFFLLVLDPGLLTSAADPARIGVCGDAAHNPANRSCQASPRSFRTTATERERRSAIGTIDVADRVHQALTELAGRLVRDKSL